MNWKHKTIFLGDNLHVMRGMNSESVDLIYLDPPFNSKKIYKAPVGTPSTGASFEDVWKKQDIDIVEHSKLRDTKKATFSIIEASRHTHSDSMFSYLIMMTPRLIEMYRILKGTGSIYLHCDPTASHYLKLLMDSIFHYKNFRNEIIWHYQTGGASKKWYAKKHDVILYYTKSDNYIFNAAASLMPRTEKSIARAQNPKGARIGIRDKDKLPMDVWTDINALNPQAKERTGYPTQKPLALLERIINISSNKDDIVFDPFCGCATTCVAADRLHRNWVGCDFSDITFDLVQRRIKEDQGVFKDINSVDVIPKRTDIGNELTPKEQDDYKKTLYGMQEGCCGGCKGHFELRNMEKDHIHPKAKGGTDHKENFQLLCGSCNRIKGGGKTQEDLMVALKEKGYIKNDYWDNEK